jgi:hypothetical protein
VGSIRQFLGELEGDLTGSELPPDLGGIRVATGSLGARVFERYVWPLLRANGVRVLPELLPVRNDFFGASVTCSGLLVGADIVKAVREAGGADRITFIPPNCLNYDNVTIDAMTVDDLSRELGATVVAPAESFIDALCEHAVSGAAEA